MNTLLIEAMKAKALADIQAEEDRAIFAAIQTAWESFRDQLKAEGVLWPEEETEIVQKHLTEYERNFRNFRWTLGDEEIFRQVTMVGTPYGCLYVWDEVQLLERKTWCAGDGVVCRGCARVELCSRGEWMEADREVIDCWRPEGVLYVYWEEPA